MEGKERGIPSLRVLIDTNVFIERESRWAVPEPLQELEHQLRSQGHDILIHEQSKKEIRNYENDELRRLAESKIATYAELRMARYPTSSDTGFRDEISEAETFNEQVDNALLYAVYDDQVDLLVTEDKGIHSKAEALGTDNQVCTIEDARTRFQQEPEDVTRPPSIQKAKLRDLDVDDAIFDSLKQDYTEFTNWFHRNPDRTAYVNWNTDGSLGAVLILKPGEVEKIGSNPMLGKRERLKISTLKVAEERRGTKTGEFLISIAIREAVNREIDEIYLTHYTQKQDYLIGLISQFGFTKQSVEEDGEAVFVKKLKPRLGDDPSPRECHIRFYPSYYDGTNVDKFLVPVQPEYHSRLFISYQDRQPKLGEFEGQFYSEGNAIKKAYLSHANTRLLDSEDILLFYRTKDHKQITSIGVCEDVRYGLTDPEKIQEIVGKRTVFTEYEIREMAEKSTTVLRFKWHFDLPTPIRYSHLKEENVVKGPIQAIQQISHDDYSYVKKEGGIDERFTIN